MALDIGANFKITAGVAGQAAVDKLNAGVDQLDKGLGRLPGAARTAGLALAGLGAGLSVAVFKQRFDDVVKSILDVKDASERTGSAIEKIGGLVQAAKITGDEFGTIEAGITRMNKALAGSDDEAKGAAKALAAIGLSIKELRQLDPAEAFSKIAEAMGEFEDGGGKAAVAMDIFGKNGAALLPFMKDFVEIGPQVSKVTAEQADQAERYERNVRLLQTAQQSLYRIIANEALPVADAFVGSLRDTIEKTNGVKSAAQGLAQDGALKSAFAEAARAGAALLDVLSLLVKGVAQVADSFSVVWNDIVTGAKVAALGVGAGFTQEGRDAIKKALDERAAYVESANKRLAERFTDLSPYTTALEQRLQGVFANGGRGSADDPRRTDAQKPRSLAGYQSREPTGPKQSKADPFGDALDSLGQDAAKLQEQIAGWKKYGDAIESARGAQARYQVESGKFKDLGEKQKTMLVMQADAVDMLAQRLKEVKLEAEYNKQIKAIDAETAAMGLNNREREMLLFGRELETKGIQQGTEAYNRMIEARRGALERRDEARADPMLGVKEGLAELADRAKDTATTVREGLVGAFEKGSDALADFVVTGKLNFGDLARSILADLAKMIMKQLAFNALKAAFGAFGGGFADGGVFGSAGVTAFASGGVVNSPTPFRFANGGKMQNGLMGEAGPEAIMPLRRGKDGKLGVVAAGGHGGDGVSIGSIVVQNNGEAQAQETSGKNAAAMGRALASVIQNEIIKQKRPGGLLSPV